MQLAGRMTGYLHEASMTLLTLSFYKETPTTSKAQCDDLLYADTDGLMKMAVCLA